MRLVVQVRLLPTPEEASALQRTLHSCNAAANRASAVAYSTGKRSRNDLQKEVYAELKADFGLSAQAAVRSVKKTVDAYTTLKANVRAGNLGPRGAKRRVRAESKPIAFRQDAAQPYDDRILSWQHDSRTVSIWTTDGRLKGLRYVGHPEQMELLVKYRKGESDLVHRDGKWLLVAVCEVPEPTVSEPNGWIGLDRGITNLATTSDGTNYQGRRLGRYRRWQARKRAELQARQTRSASRRAKRMARRETRHAAHANHKISKEIVAVAQRTGRGVAVEDLGGIRERARPSRDQRAALSSWPFDRLGEYLAYKCRLAGVAFLEVDASYTSQRCPRCGHTERGNRPTRDQFRCRRCGLAGPSDHVAGVNVRERARLAWGFVNSPALQET
ncbi:transposase [Streptomyces sp. WMMC500]|uniref:RNA-guided endonuclease InsQ/TnpB family protein n=1 Tax=Streptomyces sp. WMMC500 TaxID=3015154 RepID=UPI00248CAEB7|nr:transposase [Streptomyces sp. WMMC500]WBB62350.1 transposase [Streptomyces sp. WMMC500]